MQFLNNQFDKITHPSINNRNRRPRRDDTYRFLCGIFHSTTVLRILCIIGYVISALLMVLFFCVPMWFPVESSNINTFLFVSIIVSLSGSLTIHIAHWKEHWMYLVPVLCAQVLLMLSTGVGMLLIAILLTIKGLFGYQYMRMSPKDMGECSIALLVVFAITLFVFKVTKRSAKFYSAKREEAMWTQCRYVISKTTTSKQNSGRSYEPLRRV